MVKPISTTNIGVTTFSIQGISIPNELLSDIEVPIPTINAMGP